MFRAMLNGSRAVLRAPSIATFEAHERNNVLWATLYVAVAAALSAVFGALATALHRPYLEAEFGDLVLDVEQALPATEQGDLESLLVPRDIGSAMAGNAAGTLAGFFAFLCVVYVLGRILGGRGAFGELAYDVALFWAPLSVLAAIINIASIGVFAFFAVPLGLAVVIYQLFLTFLSIRSGMNLSGTRALAVILIPVLVVLLLFCVLVALIVAGEAGESAATTLR